MRNWSLRAKLTVWASLLVASTLLCFGVFSAWTLYQQQLQEAKEDYTSFPQTLEEFKAEEEEEVRTILRDLLKAYVYSLPFAIVIAAVGVWLLTRKALQPVREIAEAVEQIHAKALHKRLVIPPANDEIGKLAVILNRVFERLEKSFAQSSRFSADASHELKTPLAIMRAEIEDSLKREPADARVFEDLLEQTQRISAITAKLLLLARADAGQLQPEKTMVDISGLCADLMEDAEILASPRRIRVGGEIAPGLKILGDDLLLRQALLNLLDNAIKYNVEEGKIEVVLHAERKVVSITVSNTGPGIPEAHFPRIFERFYRADASRSLETGGNGLGLSLCREIIMAHGGQIRFESKGGMTAFIIELPQDL